MERLGFTANRNEIGIYGLDPLATELLKIEYGLEKMRKAPLRLTPLYCNSHRLLVVAEVVGRDESPDRSDDGVGAVLPARDQLPVLEIVAQQVHPPCLAVHLDEAILEKTKTFGSSHFDRQRSRNGTCA